MYINQIKLINFRNFRENNFTFPHKHIVLKGENGVGKTNVLESIYLLCTGKSQRKSRRFEMINFNAEYFYIEGDFFFNNNKNVNAALGFGKENKSSYLIENVKTDNFLEWFGCRPALAFCSDDINLIYGPPENRRKFFDLFGSYLESSYLNLIIQYRYWLIRKNHLLHKKFDVIQCDLYDEKIAHYGTELIFQRRYLLDQLKKYFCLIYNKIFSNSEAVDILYESSPRLVSSSKNLCKNVFYNMLCDYRKRDLKSGFSSFGPHRDDITILLNGRRARHFSSRGQGRSLALSLKLASSISIENHFKESIIYLVDDTVSELDALRSKKFFPYIQERGQVFIAAPEGNNFYDKDFFYINISDYK